jgi:ABC-type thiamine transport system ATPase subunit
MNARSGDDFAHPWLIERIPDEILGSGGGRYRRAMFRVRSSNEPLVILDSLAEMQEVLREVERAAVEEARAQGATWSQVAEALHRTRQAAEQRFG